tara:strand:- start:511 stop:678 length:168 start_codon:yes stop_codon:yes gene_type:complete
MKQANSFVDTMSLTCVLINIGLFLFAWFDEQPELTMLALFNVTCFLVYFLISGRK